MICPICDLRMRSTDDICIRCGTNVARHLEAADADSRSPRLKKIYERMFRDQKFRQRAQLPEMMPDVEEELRLRWQKVLDAEKNLRKILGPGALGENFSDHRSDRSDADADLSSLEQKTRRLAKALREAEAERDIARERARELEQKGAYAGSRMAGAKIEGSGAISKKKADLLAAVVSDNEKLVEYLKTKK